MLGLAKPNRYTKIIDFKQHCITKINTATDKKLCFLSVFSAIFYNKSFKTARFIIIAPSEVFCQYPKA